MKPIALMGPTASGKTQLAIQLAQKLDGEVISVDSSLVYKGMDIGTAKPSIEERAGIVHHLIDLLDPLEAFSTGQFRKKALNLVDDIMARGKRPILAGGTMLYFNTLFNGLAELPKADPVIRKALEAEAALHGWHKLHDELKRVDAAAGERIHPNDPQRIQRALEVYRITGISLTELCEKSQVQEPFDCIRLVVAPSDREVLRERIRQRFLIMLQQGLIEEVQALFDRADLHEGLPSIRAVGYRQVWAYLKGETAYDEMVERAIISTRQFAKRQFTWLRHQTTATQLVSEDEHLLEKALKTCQC